MTRSWCLFNWSLSLERREKSKKVFLRAKEVAGIRAFSVPVLTEQYFFSAGCRQVKPQRGCKRPRRPGRCSPGGGSPGEGAPPRSPSPPEATNSPARGGRAEAPPLAALGGAARAGGGRGGEGCSETGAMPAGARGGCPCPPRGPGGPVTHHPLLPTPRAGEAEPAAPPHERGASHAPSPAPVDKMEAPGGSRCGWGEGGAPKHCPEGAGAIWRCKKPVPRVGWLCRGGQAARATLAHAPGPGLALALARPPGQQPEAAAPPLASPAGSAPLFEGCRYPPGAAGAGADLATKRRFAPPPRLRPAGRQHVTPAGRRRAGGRARAGPRGGGGAAPEPPRRGAECCF